MKCTGRSLLLCLLCLALAGFSACGTEETTGDDPPGSGWGTDDGEPPESFIPVLTEVCDPATDAEYQAAQAMVHEVAEASTVITVATISLCDETSSCGDAGACTEADNPMLTMLRAADTWLHPEYLTGLQGNESSLTSTGQSVMEKYVNQALAFPFRSMVFAIPPGADTMDGTSLISVLNLMHAGCDATAHTCDKHHWGPDTLTTDCKQLNTMFEANVDANFSIATPSSSTAAFGFAVPLVANLSEGLSITNLNDFVAWVEKGDDGVADTADDNDILDVGISNISVTYTKQDDGTYCGRLSGEIDVAKTFGTMVESADKLSDWGTTQKIVLAISGPADPN